MGFANRVPRAPQRHIHVREDHVARIKWVFGILPLPIVNYPLLWRRHKPQDLRHAITATILSIFTMALRIIRWLLYFLCLGNYLLNALNIFMMFASLATFSESAMSDIYSYVLRDSQTLLDRRVSLAFGRDDLSRNSPLQLIYSMLAMKLDCFCVSMHFIGPLKEGDKRRFCEVNQELLIFGFSKVFESTIPLLATLPRPFLTVFTVTVYVIYGCLVQVLGFNVMLFFLLLMGYRMKGFLPFFIRYTKACWKGLLELVL